MRRDPDGKVTLSTEEARAGETSGHVRVVLIVGLVLAIAGMAIAYLTWF